MDEYFDVELKYHNLGSPICWKHIFYNTSPIEIEIGFGKCGFLIDIATQHPSVNFVGIESSRKYYRKGIKKIQRAQLKNTKLIWGEAFHIFKRYIPDTSIVNVYINFPDPWPKKRHAKRRLLQHEFVALIAQKLYPAGCIEIATDAEAYMDDTRNIFEVNDSYEMLYYSTSSHSNPQRQYFSDYEKMFLQEGKTIYYTKYKKKK